MMVYQFHAKSIDGRVVDMSAYKGQVLLIVNVASRCGFTPQYAGLQKLYDTYKDKGFAVLAFPSNQFAGQEPGNEEEIKSFCQTNYGVTFPLFAKIDVNGPQADPLFVFLKKAKPGLLGTQRIKWNFTKFLLDRQGHILKRYAPQDKPQKLETDILAALSVPV